MRNDSYIRGAGALQSADTTPASFFSSLLYLSEEETSRRPALCESALAPGSISKRRLMDGERVAAWVVKHTRYLCLP